MHSGLPLSVRLATFRQNFKQLLGRRQGYDELSQLDQPLVESGTDGASGIPEVSSDAHYVGQYKEFPAGPQPSLPYRPHQAQSQAVPTQSEDLRQLLALGREAAEIMWEMAALKDYGDAAVEMRVKSSELQAQLRGMIGDYRDEDERTLAAALEVFDLLTRTLEEYEGVDIAAEVATERSRLSGGTSLPTPNEVAEVPSGAPAGCLSGNPFESNILQVGGVPTPRMLGGKAPMADNPSVITAPGHKPAGDEAPLIEL
eukprot:jgi/Botrbrau1/18084/Bobra.0062s0070.1